MKDKMKTVVKSGAKSINQREAQGSAFSKMTKGTNALNGGAKARPNPMGSALKKVMGKYAK